MYFLPNWDKALIKRNSKIKNNKFYLSMTQISPIKTGPVKGSITTY